MGWGWVVQGWTNSPLWAKLGLVMLALVVLLQLAGLVLEVLLQLADLVLRSWKGVAMAAVVMGVMWGCCGSGCERTAHAAPAGAKHRTHAQRVRAAEARDRKEARDRLARCELWQPGLSVEPSAGGHQEALCVPALPACQCHPEICIAHPGSRTIPCGPGCCRVWERGAVRGKVKPKTRKP